MIWTRVPTSAIGEFEEDEDADIDIVVARSTGTGTCDTVPTEAEIQLLSPKHTALDDDASQPPMISILFE